MNESYQLYTNCFAEPVGLPHFLSKTQNCSWFTHTENGNLVGAVAHRSDSILLLYVHLSQRRKGIGSSLLHKAERAIRQTGAEKIHLGYSYQQYLYQGVPYLHDNGAVLFFEKQGYTAEWISVDLYMPLGDFQYIPEETAHTRFVYTVPDSRNKLQEAVHRVNPDWVRFFGDSDKPILLVKVNGEIAGFAHVNKDGFPPVHGNEKVGGVGCVGIVPEFREKGLGRHMVLYGTQLLKEMDCDYSYIFFTHLDTWYQKMGHRLYNRFWMGEKNI